eukprot:4721480-Amphidinium_carterae.1
MAEAIVACLLFRKAEIETLVFKRLLFKLYRCAQLLVSRGFAVQPWPGNIDDYMSRTWMKAHLCLMWKNAQLCQRGGGMDQQQIVTSIYMQRGNITSTTKELISLVLSGPSLRFRLSFSSIGGG